MPRTTPPKHNFVVGFAFDQPKAHVVLIEKNRPTWQAGRLNGIGGKINLGEVPSSAMHREFYEEAGVRCNDWHHFATIEGVDWQLDHTGHTLARIFVFETSLQWVYEKAKTMTDEPLVRLALRDLWEMHTRLIPNLPVLIPLALSTEFQRPIKLEWSPETIERKKIQLGEK
jgi:8-oxo-dGTP diphosphatase